MRFLRAVALVAVCASAGILSGCDSHPKGPAEKAGQKLDDAKDKLSDTVNPKGPVEKAGRAMDRATGN